MTEEYHDAPPVGKSDPTIEYKESPEHWRPTLPGKRCRYVGGSPRRGCGRPAILECDRNHIWWSYCEDHSYNRVIRDGEVWYVEPRDG